MEAVKIESLSSAIFSMQQEIASLKALITVQQGQIDALNIRVASLEDAQCHGSHPPPQQRPSRTPQRDQPPRQQQPQREQHPSQRNQRQQSRDQQRPQRRGQQHPRGGQIPPEMTDRHRIEFPRLEEQPNSGSTADEWENPQEWE